MSQDEQLLTIKQLALKLSCSESSVRRMVRNNMIPYYDILSSYRFDLNEVLDTLRRNGKKK